MMCFVLSFGNLVLLSCLKSLINMKTSHPRPTETSGAESHSEGKWNNPLERSTEAAARHRYSHNSSDLFWIILHGQALIAGHPLQHLNTILERQSDNHLVRIPRLLLTMIIASVANVTALEGNMGGEKQREEEVSRSQSLHSQPLPSTSLQPHTEPLFGSQVYC